MKTAWVLLTALPPTRGHVSLIEFADRIANRVEVIVATQPSEPYVVGRAKALYYAFADTPSVNTRWFNKEIEQNPQAPGFWDMWREIFYKMGFEKGDLIVASEPYGADVAREVGGKFIPYDMNREILPIKATSVRQAMGLEFKNMIPEFQKYVRPRITIFGAESCGKTTLAKNLAHYLDGLYLPEYARPYLEAVGAELTQEKMTDIMNGQYALQKSAHHLARDKKFIIQDTDLYSTIGYWEGWGDKKPPIGLYHRAAQQKSDLYIVCTSTIPFEKDALRYGGDKREHNDDYWLDLLERHGLNYTLLCGDGISVRTLSAAGEAGRIWDDKTLPLATYERRNNG